MDSRAATFRDWLFSAAMYTDITLMNMTEPEDICILGTYLDHTARSRKNPTTNNPVMAKTLVQHLNTAAHFLRLATHLIIPIHGAGYSASPRLLPWLGDIIHSQQQWQQPLPKRLPYTYAMFRALHELLCTWLQSDSSIWLDKTAAVFDWSCLRIFTGSRSGEYAQTVAKRNEFARVPNSWAAPPQWRNTPIAFIAADFSFYDQHLRLVSISLLLDLSTPDPLYVHVRFRFDKSSTNFTIRKYKQGQGFLCPVRTARSILRRASTLKVPAGNPVGAFRTHPSGSFTYLQSANIIKVMCMSVDFAYPDPNHYYRLNRAAIVAHSNRVTAAVALHANGRPIPEIAFRLRCV